MFSILRAGVKILGRLGHCYESWHYHYQIPEFAELAKCENVCAKLGGLALSVGGAEWMRRDLPPTSDEFVEMQRPFFLHMIESFGPGRCMFESNFPVDKLAISYPILWNGFKKIVEDFSDGEKDALFSKTAHRVYRI